MAGWKDPVSVDDTASTAGHTGWKTEISRSPWRPASHGRKNRSWAAGTVVARWRSHEPCSAYSGSSWSTERYGNTQWCTTSAPAAAAAPAATTRRGGRRAPSDLMSDSQVAETIGKYVRLGHVEPAAPVGGGAD